MKKTELRLGNLVEYPGWNKDGSSEFFMIRDLFWEGEKIALTNGVIQLPSTKLGLINPIALTKEWLIKFGFYKEFESGLFIIPSSTLKLDYYDSDEGYMAVVFGNDLKLIKYVHQLQNLYFALTGEELTLKTEL